MSTIQKIALAIVSVGALTVLVTNGPNSAKVIGSVGQAFSGSLRTAMGH